MPSFTTDCIFIVWSFHSATNELTIVVIAIIVVYFDARTKINLQNYLESRTDDNPALFVSLKSPHERLKIGGVEVRLREFGKQLGINKSPYLIWIPNHGKNRSFSQKIAKL